MIFPINNNIGKYIKFASAFQGPICESSNFGIECLGNFGERLKHEGPGRDFGIRSLL